MRKKDGLHSKVLNFQAFTNYQGRFIAYCDLPVHRGLVMKPHVCERRQCDYYHKFYIDNQEWNQK